MADQQPNDSISGANTLDAFRYRPFQYSDEIRVLQILPNNAKVFKCEMLTVRLSEDPEYAALSYTLGDPDSKYAAVSYKTDSNAKTTIERDGASFMITNNLHDALCLLRDKHEVITIWVDQICS
jgi:hypothetical protein